jgi:hypothetical protein
MLKGPFPFGPKGKVRDQKERTLEITAEMIDSSVLTSVASFVFAVIPSPVGEALFVPIRKTDTCQFFYASVTYISR